MNKDWTNQLPELLENQTATPPEGLWEAVEGSLSAGSAATGASAAAGSEVVGGSVVAASSAAGAGRHQTRAVWWITGALSAAAAIALAVFVWNPSASSPEPLADASEASVNEPLSDASVAPVGGTLAETSGDSVNESLSEVPSAAAPVAPSSFKNTPTTAKTTSTATEPSPTVASSNPTSESTEPITEQILSGSGTDKLADNSTNTDASTLPDPFLSEPTKPASPRRQRLQLSVSGGGYLAQAGTLSSTDIGLPSVSSSTSSLPSIQGRGLSLRTVTRNQPSTTDASYRQGPRVALMVGYNFAPRWSVSSGLSYSVLTADIKTSIGTSSQADHRTQGYIGIPLYLQFNALEIKWFSLYLNAGPMFETCVHSTSRTTTYAGEKLMGTETIPNLRLRDNIWSVNASAGLQFQLFRHGALFVQPGLSWHLAKHVDPTPIDPSNPASLTPAAASPYETTFYTTHPLAFDLTIGYRILLF